MRRKESNFIQNSYCFLRRESRRDLYIHLVRMEKVLPERK
jgi:hypothetical protein